MAERRSKKEKEIVNEFENHLRGKCLRLCHAFLSDLFDVCTSRLVDLSTHLCIACTCDDAGGVIGTFSRRTLSLYVELWTRLNACGTRSRGVAAIGSDVLCPTSLERFARFIAIFSAFFFFVFKYSVHHFTDQRSDYIGVFDSSSFHSYFCVWKKKKWPILILGSFSVIIINISQSYHFRSRHSIKKKKQNN